MGRVDPQIYGDVGDTFVLSCEAVSFILNFFPHLIKVCEDATFAVQELSRLWNKRLQVISNVIKNQ